LDVVRMGVTFTIARLPIHSHMGVADHGPFGTIRREQDQNPLILPCSFTLRRSR
jgi:hypothetical protein